MSDDDSPAQAPAAEPGRVYRTVTRYWPRIAVTLVFLAGVSEWVIGGLTADSGIEFYVMAWATTTGGLWFLFERAEKALAGEIRESVSDWVRAADIRSGIGTIPSQFAFLFDRVFGEKHLSRNCFKRSCVASFMAFLTVYAIKLSGDDVSVTSGVFPAGFELVMAGVMFMGWVAVNFVLDYLSLLETRWAIGWAEDTGRWQIAVILDFVLTASITVLVIGLFGILMGVPQFLASSDPTLLGTSSMGLKGYPAALVRLLLLPGGGPGDPLQWHTMQVSFLSAFFTSVWLWLYAASVVVSRVLVRMSGGVGFLLKVTDVETQPFRSMGFTSVVLVSLLFLAGLPFVLLA